MSRRTFDGVEIGDRLPPLAADVSLATVRRFAKTANMPAGRFTDHDAARREGLPGAIVPGIMSQGMLVAMIHAWAPGCRVRKVDTKFGAPVLVDSKPTCKGVVTRTDPDAGSVEIDLTLVDEAGETPVMGVAVVELPRE